MDILRQYEIDFTPVHLTLWLNQDGDSYIVRFGTEAEAERIKTLYEGRDREAADAEYGEIEAHYEERREAEVSRGE